MAIQREQNYIYVGDFEAQGNFAITSGSPGVGKVLTSDGSGNATWQSSSSGVILSSTVTLTSAQILQLHTTPITLVAGQGAGTVILPIAAMISMTYNSAAYATDTSLLYTLGGGSYTTQSGVLALTSDFASIRTFLQNATISGSIYWDNGALEVTTPSSNPTLGDSDLKITVLYSVISI